MDYGDFFGDISGVKETIKRIRRLDVEEACNEAMTNGRFRVSQPDSCTLVYYSVLDDDRYLYAKDVTLLLNRLTAIEKMEKEKMEENE